MEALLDRGAEERVLQDVAQEGLDTVSSEEPLRLAAEKMRDRHVSHLVVSDAHNGRPVGMLSTLDIAGILAWGEA